MSKYLTFTDVVFKDKKLLLQALAQCGYDEKKLEIGENLTMYGYHGDARPERCDIIIRRKHIGSSSNDVGFTKTDAGYVPVVSEFDNRSGFNGAAKMPKIRTAYNERVVAEVAKRMRGTVTAKTEGSTKKLFVRY